MAEMDSSPRYLNRELSWLEFNQRVLDEALDGEKPLLERLKFLAISSSNLDEFFMVRVAGLRRLSGRNDESTDPAGLTADQQLEAIRARAQEMVQQQYACYMSDLEPALRDVGITRLLSDELNERQAESLSQVFENEIYPILTPMAVASTDEFPLLTSQTLNICVQLAHEPDDDAAETPRFAVIPCGRATARFITLPTRESGYEYILLEDVVALYIDRFFPGEDVVACTPFRITRDADLAIREDFATDLLERMEEVLDARKLSDCVRLEVSQSVTNLSQQFLQQALEAHDVFHVVPGPLDLAAFMRLADVQGFNELRFEAWSSNRSPAIDPTVSMFETIAQRDVLMYHPFESFEPVVRLIEEAAADPDVLAIKQILYRTSRNSPIIAALRTAAQNGKHVTALIEVKARFDEARNIEWAKNLAQNGVYVQYGVRGLKTHAKLCVIIRRESHGIQRYMHFGTGNYNEVTARFYTDASYLTCDEDLGMDAINFFNAICGYSQLQRFRKIEAAPLGMRQKILQMIQDESERHRQGQRGHIMAKMNSLVDPEIISALYAASQAGVRIDLVIRGICCLRPGVPGLSEQIRVISIVDRLLEHSRILYFRHGGDERVWISSADWMPRNLNRRVELLVPVDDPAAAKRLVEILRLCLKDNRQAKTLAPDGSYSPASPDGHRDLRSQTTLQRLAAKAEQEQRTTQRTVFEPHLAPDPHD